MTTFTESDIKELKDLINQRFDELKADGVKRSEQIKNLETGQANLEAGQANLSEQINSLETGQVNLSEQIKTLTIEQAKIETRMDEWKTAINKIPDLAEKIGELKNWRQIAFVVITATAGGFIGWLMRGGNFNP